MSSESAKQFRQENLVIFSNYENERDGFDDKFEAKNLYDWKSESNNLDFICQNCILLTFKYLIISI